MALPTANLTGATDAESVFGEVTTIISERTQFVVIRLDADATLLEIVMETDSEFAAVFLIGPETFYRFKIGDKWAGTPPDSHSMRAGSYSVYLHSGSMTMRSIINLDGPAGDVDVHPGIETSGFLGRLAPAGVTAPATGQLPVPGVQVFSATQPFDGVAMTGFVRLVELFAVEAETYEYRWSNSAGVVDCYSGSVLGVGAGPGAGWEVLFHPGDLGSAVTLTYFLYGATIIEELGVHGFWLNRAPGDPALFHMEPKVPLLNGIGPDYDVQCLREFSL